ncbi:MAG TPA: acyl carrier protein [Phycisphaerae bacterium]|nr:acyl carrier protein [Phycisphaerae bacterium]
MDNKQKFRLIVSAILHIPVERVTDDLAAADVETWDSLNHINLIGAIEQEFGVTLPTENLGDFMSVPELEALLGQLGVTL